MLSIIKFHPMFKALNKRLSISLKGINVYLLVALKEKGMEKAFKIQWEPSPLDIEVGEVQQRLQVFTSTDNRRPFYFILM